ncbi:MAG: hypothetical protein P9L94_16290 [Candidatus Hinthialibacter antarcticus]|nr:hypothetical protein [Candidatus Hinthialibacter antarcticus]
MDKFKIAQQSNDTFSQAFQKFESALSTQKARELLNNAENALAFDTEVFLLPIRRNLADCLSLVADLTRERGTNGRELQAMLPIMADYLDPGSTAAQEVARLEKKIAEKKREHPDFVMAFKLQVLIRRYEQSLKEHHPESEDYAAIKKKLDNARATLHNHMQSKVRLAQRALEPDMLEQAVSQLSLARHHQKVLRVKQELLDACRNQCHRNLSEMAKLFKDADPEVSDMILTQINAVKSTGALVKNEHDESPKTLEEYKVTLDSKQQQISSIDKHLDDCQTQLEQLQQLEEALFNTFGEQLREKGIKFEKKVRLEKSGAGMGIAKKQTAVRMVRPPRR